MRDLGRIDIFSVYCYNIVLPFGENTIYLGGAKYGL